MDAADRKTLLDALRAEELPATLPEAPPPDAIGTAMLQVFTVEERVVDCVALLMAFAEVGDLDGAHAGLGLAARWFEVWASFRAQGVEVPFSKVHGTPFYEAARFALEHAPAHRADAVRWMTWAQELSPRVDDFVHVHAQLLLALGDRARAVAMLARHRRRYPDAAVLEDLYEALGPDLDLVAFDDEAEVERRMVAARIQQETREYILGRAPSWPKHAWTHTLVFEALLDAFVPNDHPMMRRLLAALGEDDGHALQPFLDTYLVPLAKVPEAVRLGLCFLEPSGFSGWELVARTLPGDPAPHWIEGAWAYLDTRGDRAGFVARGWEAFRTQRRKAFAALLRPADPQWGARLRAVIDDAPEWHAKELLPLLDDPAALQAGYLRLVEAWLEANTSGAAPTEVLAWLRGEARTSRDEEVALLAPLRRPRHVHSFIGDVRGWRGLPDDEFFRRATRLSTTFDFHAVCVALERRGLPLADVGTLDGYVTRTGQIALLLDELEREERLAGMDGSDDPEAAAEEDAWPSIRQLAARLRALVAAHPEDARGAVAHYLADRYRTDTVLRGLALLAEVAPEEHRRWILGCSRSGPVRAWILQWVGEDPAGLAWARAELEGPHAELALLVCARHRDRASRGAFTKAYRDRPSLRAELGEALASIDPGFVTRAAFEARAKERKGKVPSVLRKGCSWPALRWLGGDPFPKSMEALLRTLLARGVGERREAQALVACLEPSDRSALAHALYVGARPKAKRSYVPAFVFAVLPGRHRALEEQMADDVLEADRRVERKDHLTQLAEAAARVRHLIAVGADEALARLASRVWSDSLRALLFPAVPEDARDHCPGRIDPEWLFGVWSAGAQWEVARWPFDDATAATLIWHDGAQPLLYEDGGFVDLDGAPATPTHVSLARSVPRLTPAARKRRALNVPVGALAGPEDPGAETWTACEGYRVPHAAMRRRLLRAGWRVGAIDREQIVESFYIEIPRLGQGAELAFRYAGAEGEHLVDVVFYRLGTALRPRNFPKGDYLGTQLLEPPLRLGEVEPLFFDRVVRDVRRIMETGTGYDPEWRNRY